MFPSGVTYDGVAPTRVVAYPGNDNSVCFDTNIRLQTRKTDFKVFANTGYIRQESDNDLLAKILTKLLENHPITVIDVSPYGLHVHFNRTAVMADIVSDVAQVASLGRNLEFRDETKV